MHHHATLAHGSVITDAWPDGQHHADFNHSRIVGMDRRRLGEVKSNGVTHAPDRRRHDGLAAEARRHGLPCLAHARAGPRGGDASSSDPPVQYLVGTPKGRLSRLEKQLLAKPWQEARPGVSVKLLAEDDELYVYAESVDRVSKERAMRRRQLKWLWKRLRELAAMEVPREEMLMKLGAARARAPTAWRLVDIEMDKASAGFSYALNRQKLRQIRRREGRYLLRTNLTENDPALLWQYYTQLVAVEEAFKNLKGDLAIRPIFHQEECRVEAHIFIAFLAYCLQITLQCRLHALAPGLTARSALEKFTAVQMIDVHLPMIDGRELVMTRYTQPEPELQLLIQQLRLSLPPQPPPRIATERLPSHPL